jgi:hypothetical protein
MLNHKIKGTASIYQKYSFAPQMRASSTSTTKYRTGSSSSSELLIHILSWRPNNVLEMAPLADTLMLHIRDQYPRRAGTDIASAFVEIVRNGDPDLREEIVKSLQ